MPRALFTAVNGVIAVPEPTENAPGRYIATDFARKPREYKGVKCNKCHGEVIFASRAGVTDFPFKLLGFVPCRCGGCLSRFFVPFWRARRR